MPEAVNARLAEFEAKVRAEERFSSKAIRKVYLQLIGFVVVLNAIAVGIAIFA